MKLKCGEDDKIKHILECEVLKIHHSNYDLADYDTKYVFSNNIVKM